MYRQVISTVLVCLAIVSRCLADDRAEDTETKTVDPRRTYYRNEAAAIEFFHDAERQKKLTFVEKPIMRWSSDDDWSGDVFAWTWEDRPEVIGCILSGPNQNNQRAVFHEFHLLSTEPIGRADMKGPTRWKPKTGVKLLRVAGSPTPANSPSARLTQMRQLLGDFTAHMTADSKWELRLLPQPLLRYQPKQGDVIDGALFAYVWPKGTDPELVMLLECRKTEQDTAWYFSPLRFSNRELWLDHKEKEVWRVPVHNESGVDSVLPYVTQYHETIRNPVSKSDKSK